MLEQGSLISFVEQASCCGIDTSSVLLNSYTFTFDPSVKVYWIGIMVGCCAVVVPPGALLLPAHVYTIVVNHSVTYLDVTPSILNVFLKANVKGFALPDRVAVVYLGGEKCEPNLVRNVLKANPQVKVYNTYGPTESTIASNEFCVTINEANAGHAVPIGPVLWPSTGVVRE